MEDFNACQSVYRKELKDLEKYVLGEKNCNVSSSTLMVFVSFFFLLKAVECDANYVKEALWSRDNMVLRMNECMENRHVSLALGPTVLPSLYFVGPKVSQEIVHSSEYHNLFKLMSIHGRLMNPL